MSAGTLPGMSGRGYGSGFASASTTNSLNQGTNNIGQVYQDMGQNYQQFGQAYQQATQAANQLRSATTAQQQQMNQYLQALQTALGGLSTAGENTTNQQPMGSSNAIGSIPNQIPTLGINQAGGVPGINADQQNMINAQQQFLSGTIEPVYNNSVGGAPSINPQDLYNNYAGVAFGQPKGEMPPSNLAPAPTWEQLARYNDAYRTALGAPITRDQLVNAGATGGLLDNFMYDQLRGGRAETNRTVPANWANMVISDLSPEQKIALKQQEVDSFNKSGEIYNRIYDQAYQNFLAGNARPDVNIRDQFRIQQLQTPGYQIESGLSPEQQYQKNQEIFNRASSDYYQAMESGLNNLNVTPEMLAAVGYGVNDIQSIMSRNPGGMTYQQLRQTPGLPIGTAWLPDTRVNTEDYIAPDPFGQLANQYRTAFREINKQPVMQEVEGYTPPVFYNIPGGVLPFDIDLSGSPSMNPQDLYNQYSSVVFGQPGSAYTPNFQG